ncbi:MAG: lamin tail domain-containing protein [Polyangia bacterium]
MKKALVLALLAAGCTVDRVGDSTEAQLVSPDLVIAEVYGGGGNTGAQYKNDFVVLFNRGTSPVSMTGKQLLYGSATGKSATSVALMGNIAAGASYLVQLAGGTTGASLPTSQVSSTAINISGSTGKLAVADSTVGPCTLDFGACTSDTAIDFVGWGPTASQFETAYAPLTSNTSALLRRGGGCIDTGNNGNDFTVEAPAPRNAASGLVDCATADLLQPDDDAGAQPDLQTRVDMAKASDMKAAPDFSSVDFGAGPYLINEVKWNPGGADTGAEFVELIGAGALPPYTYLLSVDGDTTATGRINLVHDLSLTAFGSNGLILVQGSTTTFAGTAAETNLVEDTALKASPIQNGTETVLLVHSDAPLTIVAGTTKYTDLTGLTVFDSIAAKDTTGAAFGPAVFTACPAGAGASPVDGAFRIVGNMTASDVTAWYAGQAVGGPFDQGLNDVSACSGGPATATMSPGRLNDDPLVPPVDMSTVIVDMSNGTHDAAVPKPDFAEPLDMTGIQPTDAAVHHPDMAHTSTRGGTSGGGCAVGGSDPTPLTTVFFLALLGFVVRRRRIA